MIQLAARDALTPLLKRVNVDQRPGHDRSSVFAVFENDEPDAALLGLVTPDQAASFSERIFADLLPAQRTRSVLADWDLAAIGVEMDTVGAGALSVLDGGGHLLGAVTRESLWAAMLTQQRFLMAELATREAQQRAMLNAIPDQLLCVSPDGTMLQMREVEPVDDSGSGPPGRALEVDGSDGKALIDVFPKEVSATLKDGIERTRASGRSDHASFNLPGPAASPPLQYEARFVPWGDGNVLIVCRDVTEVNALRAKMIQTDRMVSIGTLAAGVAHEINNPLTYISTNLDLLTELVASEAARNQRLHEATSMLQDIRDGVDRVQRTVRDLKLFSRSDELSRTVVDLKEVIVRVLRIANNEIRHRAILYLELGAVPLVDANDGQIGQVLLNLLVNAAQAIPEGAAGRNEIRVVTFTDQQGRAVVEIHDTGSGIPDDIKRRIFDPFFTTKEVGVGTGLGLSICNNIILNHGGDIQVDSTVGQGSVFRLVLPASTAAPIAASLRRGSLSPTISPTMLATRPIGLFLIVDDEPAILAMYRRLLGADQCVSCSSGRQALDLIRQGDRFDAIVCDLMMPDTSGMDVYDELARIAPEQAARMVFATGGGFTDRSRSFLAGRTNQVLEKPFKATVLFDCLTRVVHEGPTDFAEGQRLHRA